MMVGVVISLLVGLVGLCVGTGAVGSCPQPGDILPCLCVDDDSLGPTMDCSGVEEEPELAQVFAVQFPSLDFYELRIIHDPTNLNHRLYSLEASTLGDATFERVTITGTQIITIDGYAFDRSKSTLQILALSGNRINDFPFGSLPRYTALTTLLLSDNLLLLLPQVISESLEVLDVSDNVPLELERNAFSGSPSLLEIDLSHTGQESLQSGHFVELGKVREIDLSNNYLTRLEEAAIVTAAASMTLLNLTRNEISFVHSDSIVGLASNAALYMVSNDITELTQDSWQHIFDQLQQPEGLINLADNPLVCGCDMAWLMLDETSLNHLTDTTTCNSGEMVIFLDPYIFCLKCPPYVCS